MGASRVPIFLFLEPLSTPMTDKKTQNNIQDEAVPESPEKQVSFALSMPQNAVYATFLSVAVLVTGLLYGASFRVAHTPDIVVTVPDRHAAIRKNIETMVDGYPIASMVPYIVHQNKTTAAFLVGIAKKESNWGKRVPVDAAGADCFNYWGYRGAGSRGIEMGHGCFGSPEEAVSVVSKRVNTLVQEYEFDTPEELVVWKCGWSCDGHSNQSVKKWITDVGYYYRKVKS